MRKVFALLFTLVASAALAAPPTYRISDGTSFVFFTNTVGATGAPITVASETVDAYKDGTATAIGGVTIDDDAAITGQHKVTIDLTDSDWVAGSTYHVYYSAGTADSVSLVGRDIAIIQVGPVEADTTKIGGQTASASGTVTFPNATLASTTNITAAAGITLADDSITAAKVATDAIGAAEMAANAIGASEVADDSLDAGAIAADSIGASEVAADAIGAGELATDAIGAAEVAAGAIGNSESAVDGSELTAIPDRAVLCTGTVTVNSQTNFTLSSFGAAIGSLKFGSLIIYDASNSNKPSQPQVITSDNGSGTVAVGSSFGFTVANGDGFAVLANPEQLFAEAAPGATNGLGLLDFSGGVPAILVDGTLTAPKFGAGAIDATAIAPNAIGASELADDSIDAGALAASAGSELGTANWSTTTRALTDKAGFAISGTPSTLEAMLASQPTTEEFIGQFLATNVATGMTVNDTLVAAWAQGFGKWSISGTTLRLYGPDGTTVLRTFQLNSSTAPTSRTPQ